MSRILAKETRGLSTTTKVINKNKPTGYWNQDENVVQFLKELRNNYNLDSIEAWNSINRKQIQSNGGSTLLNKYSLYQLKCMGFPEGKQFFNKSPKPTGYWDNKENVIQFLKQLKEKLNLKTIDDWNSITNKKIRIYGGSSILQKYSLFELKSIGFPEGKYFFDLKPKPIGYWNKEENVIQFLQELKVKLHLQTPQDWNKITQKDIKSNKGGVLLHKYSIYELKCMGCPDGKSFFDPTPKPIGFWKNEENVIQFLKNLREKLNLNTPEDWNLITRKKIKFFGGSSLLDMYSLLELKSIGCPEGKLIFNAPPKPSEYWNKEENVFQFLHELKVKLHLQTPQDWNNITKKIIIFHGGSRLFNKYSLYQLKCMGFPEGKLYFDPAPKASIYWDKKENISKFLDELRIKHDLKTPEDWGRLSKIQIKSHGGDGLASKFSLQEIFDFQNINVKLECKNIQNKRSSQRWLFLQIKKLFPDEEIIEDYFHSQISRESGYSVQFDIFLINRNIAIEYHGKQHYEDIPTGFAPFEMYKYRDQEKAKICKQYCIQLIVIPYWWDNNLDSLKSTVAFSIKQSQPVNCTIK